MTSNKKVLGEHGEKLARKYLLQKDYQIISVNYQNRQGEIDIIAVKQEFIIFIEVKTRNNHKYGTPQSAVDYRKQEKIKKMAHYFLLNHNFKGYKIRFDVIAITIKQSQPHIEQFINAF